MAIGIAICALVSFFGFMEAAKESGNIHGRLGFGTLAALMLASGLFMVLSFPLLDTE